MTSEQFSERPISSGIAPGTPAPPARPSLEEKPVDIRLDDPPKAASSAHVRLGFVTLLAFVFVSVVDYRLVITFAAFMVLVFIRVWVYLRRQRNRTPKAVPVGTMGLVFACMGGMTVVCLLGVATYFTIIVLFPTATDEVQKLTLATIGGIRLITIPSAVLLFALWRYFRRGDLE